MATTASMQAKQEGKRADEADKAVSAMAARPAAWLKEEVTAVTAGQQLREQVAMTIELRRQCALKLQAIELRAEEASQAMTAYEGGDASSSAAEAAAEMASRQAEAEALRLKVAHYSSELVSLQTKLVHQESSETAVAKLEAVPDLKQAKAMLKAAFPQLVNLQLSVHKREQQLEAKAREMQSKEAGDAGEIELTSLENVKGAAAAKKLGAKPRAPTTTPSAAAAAKPRAALGRIDGNAAGADVAGGFSKAVTKPASAKGEAGGTRKLLNTTQVVSVNLVDNE
ncbi:hypothetical protein Ctob_002126 [Chrysochromulina tobinii]|uniref:Uncharacterized protein n=1 Tax=Chrysochromulina tobinii TaxID=1460289 RepID=A0A0M0JC55_9EUKA|nr:hypothetical protein Ctob_002126 [Chrysochromulina tobinii]|eukprot:KOO24159.1 hypothetical protein Ctob_002126 [Chrysochromulina sp. CCMP291]